MRVKCANCNTIWDRITVNDGAATSPNSDLCYICPYCHSNAYDPVVTPQEASNKEFALLCPECGENDAYNYGPPDDRGGERYQISAAYCNCGYVYYLHQFSFKQNRIRTFREITENLGAT